MLVFDQGRIEKQGQLGMSVEISTDSRRKCRERFSFHIVANDNRTILLELNNIDICIFYAAGSEADPSSWATASFDLKIHYYPHLANTAAEHKFGIWLVDDGGRPLDEITLGSFPNQCGNHERVNLRKDFDARYFDFAVEAPAWADIIQHNDYRRC